MASGRLIIPLAEPVLTAAGVPAVGATLTVYQTGTTTLANLFSDQALTQPVTNPQFANSAGRFYTQTRVIWADASIAYDVTLALPTGESFTYPTIWLLGSAQSVSGFAPIDSPHFTGVPTAPTPAANDSSQKLATTAFAANLVNGLAPLNSPNFSGSPTAPTPTAGDSSTKIATTAFVSALASGKVNLSANGYIWFPSGILIQWGSVTGVSIGQTSFTVPVPVSFDAAPYFVSFTNSDTSNTQSNFMNQGSHTTNQLILVVHRGAGATSNVSAFTWAAIGPRALTP